MSQTSARITGENRAQRTLIQLLCAVSIWRTVMTRLLPLCGASAWWVGLLCLLPGVVIALMLRLIQFGARCKDMHDAFRAALGQTGAWLLSRALAIPLLADGLSSLTALLTLFTQGIGTRGTQLTLAVLTGGMLLLSLHREGLARAAYLLRWGMTGAVLVLAVSMAGKAQLDGIFPLYGEGEAAVFAAVKAGVSLAWPLVLLLTNPPAVGRGRLQAGILPVCGAVAMVFLLTMRVPHELLAREDKLAALLLLPVRYSSNALRLLGLSTMMLALFLSVGAAVQLGTKQLCSPMKHRPAWLPQVLMMVLLLSQAIAPARLWRGLGRLEPWLLAPLACLSAVTLPMAFIRRKTG